MTPSTFNHRLLRAKDRALDTLEELCAPAFVPPAPIPTHRDDGSSIPYEERMALFKAQTARCKPDEKRVIVQERATRVRAANAILRTRPIDDNGNPLPTSPQHPEHHTRTKPRIDHAANNTEHNPANPDRDPTSPERERAGPSQDPANSERDPASATTDPRPEGAPTQPAGSPAGTQPPKRPRSRGPTNDASEENSSAFQAESTSMPHNRQVNLRGGAAEIARPPSERADALPDARPPPYALLLSGPLLYAAPPRPRPHPFDDVEGWHGTGMVNLKRYPRRRSRAR